MSRARIERAFSAIACAVVNSHTWKRSLGLGLNDPNGIRNRFQDFAILRNFATNLPQSARYGRESIFSVLHESRRITQLECPNLSEKRISHARAYVYRNASHFHSRRNVATAASSIAMSFRSSFCSSGGQPTMFRCRGGGSSEIIRRAC